MAESVEQGSLETVLHIDIDKNDVTAITKQLSAIAKDSTLQNGFKALGDTMSKSIVSSTSGFDRLQASIERVADIIAELEERITGLPTSIAKNTLAKSAKESASEFEQLKKKVEELSAALSNNDKVQSSTGKTTNLLIQQQRQLKAELSNLIATGQQATPQFKEIEARYAAITDEIADMQQRVKALANDEGFTQGMIQGLGGLAASFQVAQGAIGMFADENEELNKILVKVQSLMGIVNGLMTIQQTINKDSTFMQTVMNKASEKWVALKAKTAAIWAKDTAATVANTGAKVANNLQTELGAKGTKETTSALIKDTAAETANTSAKAAGATANGVLSKSFKTLGVAIKSIPAVGWVLAIVGAVVGAIKLIGDWIDEEKRKEKELIEVKEESYNVFAKESLLLEENIRKVETFNGTQKDEAKLVDDLNNKYGDSLGHFQTLAEWKQVLIDKGQQYVDMLMLESQAEALRNKAAETYAKKIKTQALDADQLDEANGTAEKALKTLLSGPFAAFTSAYQNGVAGVIEDVNERTKKELLATLDAEEKAYKDELEKILQDLDETRNKLNQGRPDAEFTYIQKLQNDLKNVQDVIQTVDQFGSGAMRNGVFVSLDELKKEDQAIQDRIRQFQEMTGQETYLQKLQRLRADAQREIERTDPNNVAAINRAKVVVHNIDEQIKAYQDLITYHTYIQQLQNQRSRAMEKLEGMNTTKATQEEIDKQKEVVRQLDEQIKAHQRKIAVNSYYEQILADISEKEEKLKKLSLEDAKNPEKVNNLKKELLQLEEQKKTFEDLISTNTYYQSLQQSIARDKEKLNSLTEEELEDTEAINRLRQKIAENQEKQRKYEEATKLDFSEDAKRYSDFAEKYSNSLLTQKEKEDEINREIIELRKKRSETTSSVERAELTRMEQTAQERLKFVQENAQMERDIMVQEFDGTATDVTDIIASKMDEAANLSLEQIRNEILSTYAKLRQLKARQKLGENVSKEIAQTTAAITILEGKVKQAEKDLSNFNQDGEKPWDKTKDVIDGLAGAFKDLGDEIGGTGKEALDAAAMIMTTTTNLVNNIVQFTTVSIQGIKTASGVAATALKTIESASVILAIVGAVIQLTTAIAQLVSKKDPIDELRDSLHDFNLELEETKRLAAKEMSFKAFDTIFGSDEWGKMKNYIRIGEEALDSYKKIQNDIIAYADTMADTMTQHAGKGISTAIGASTLDPVTGFLHNKLFGNKSVDTVQGAYDNIEDTIANMKVKVKHKTWFRNEKATTLKDLVPSLFNDKGELDKAALHEFVESGNDAFDKLSQANQDYLKQMDNAWQEYEESVQEVRDTFSDFFGELGSQISDIWVDAFRTGEYALDDFEKSWDSAIENMVQSMAYNMTLGKIFKDAEDELDKIDFFKAPEENLDKAIGILEEAERTANDEGRTSFNAILQKFKDMGYFKADKEERQGVSGGITSLTQDTAEEMNGRMTQIQSHTFAINENVRTLTEMSSRQLVVLQGIHLHTGTLVSTVNSIRDTLDDITIKGVKLKS